MSKQDTINKYIDEFLKDRTPEAAERFRDKDPILQYASIMQWRRKLRKEANTPKSTKEITEALKRAAALIENAPSISEEDAVIITNTIETMRTKLHSYLTRQREKKIAELEQQSKLIAEQLNHLRDNQ